MHEREIVALLGNIEEHLCEPEANWPKYIFKQRSYARWAAYEIINRLMDHPFVEPALVVEEFLFTMGYFEQLANRTGKGFIFDIARDTAEDLLDLLNAMR